MPEREGLAETDSIPVTTEELHRMGLKPPHGHRECTPDKVPNGRFVGRLTFDLKPLEELLGRLKAQGGYPVSMRWVPRKKPD
jgi:hypothetical protein